MTISNSAFKAQWLLDISGGDSRTALEFGIRDGFIGDSTLELVIEKADSLRILSGIYFLNSFHQMSMPCSQL